MPKSRKQRNLESHIRYYKKQDRQAISYLKWFFIIATWGYLLPFFLLKTWKAKIIYLTWIIWLPIILSIGYGIGYVTYHGFKSLIGLF